MGGGLTNERGDRKTNGEGGWSDQWGRDGRLTNGGRGVDLTNEERVVA
jgi:hypothetical protein